MLSLEAFLRDILGGNAALLHEDDPAPAQTVRAAELGWSGALQQGFGFGDVFSHQAETYRRLKAGEHVIVTTPTASGKTGAFFPAVFEALEQDRQATALFVYPLVALGQDQREKLLAFKARGGYDWGVGLVSGQRPAGAGADAGRADGDGHARQAALEPDPSAHAGLSEYPAIYRAGRGAQL